MKLLAIMTVSIVAALGCKRLENPELIEAPIDSLDAASVPPQYAAQNRFHLAADGNAPVEETESNHATSSIQPPEGYRIVSDDREIIAAETSGRKTQGDWRKIQGSQHYVYYDENGEPTNYVGYRAVNEANDDTEWHFGPAHVNPWTGQFSYSDYILHSKRSERNGEWFADQMTDSSNQSVDGFHAAVLRNERWESIWSGAQVAEKLGHQGSINDQNLSFQIDTLVPRSETSQWMPGQFRNDEQHDRRYHFDTYQGVDLNSIQHDSLRQSQFNPQNQAIYASGPNFINIFTSLLNLPGR